MMPEEDPTTDGGGMEGTVPLAEDPQRGEQSEDTEAAGKEGDNTGMDVDGQDQQIGRQAKTSAQEKPHVLPLL